MSKTLKPSEKTLVLKRILHIAILFVLLAACKKNEVQLEFSLQGVPSDTYRLDYYASDSKKGWMVEEFANVQKGKATIVLRTVNPTLVYTGRMSDSGTGAIFYAERGDKIVIEGSTPDPISWEISGNSITDDLSEWRLSAKQAFELLRRDKTKGSAQINSLISEYVRQHPEKPASAILLLCYFDRGADEKGYEAARKLLKGKALDPRWSDIVSRADMIDDITPPDKLPDRIVLKTPSGCDTIAPGKVPVFLCFNTYSTSVQKDRINKGDDATDALRSLSKDYKDSAKRVIADISFEPDSSSRAYKIRNDSLKGIVRGWMPLGISDSTARTLGIRRVPFAIVADPQGRIRYRGSDLPEAARTFRTLLP